MVTRLAPETEIGITCKGCAFFRSQKCIIQESESGQLGLDLESSLCKNEPIIYQTEGLHEMTDREIALIVYRAFRRDPIRPSIPENIEKRVSELLDKVPNNGILWERFLHSPIGSELRRLERHLG